MNPLYHKLVFALAVLDAQAREDRHGLTKLTQPNRLVEKSPRASREIVRPYATDIVSQQQPIGNMAAHAEKIQQLKDEIRENQFAAIENTVNRAIQLIS